MKQLETLLAITQLLCRCGMGWYFGRALASHYTQDYARSISAGVLMIVLLGLHELVKGWLKELEEE